MILTVNEKNYTLTATNRKVANFKKALGGINITQALFNATQDPDPELVATGISLFGNMDMRVAYDLLDEYLEQGGDNTFITIVPVLIEALDEAGFLPQKGMGKGITKEVRDSIKELKSAEKKEEKTKETKNASQK